MRVAKMPHVYWDAGKSRAFYQRRFPADVAILTGERFRFKYPQSVSLRAAMAISHEQAAEFLARVEAVRERLGTAEGWSPVADGITADCRSIRSACHATRQRATGAQTQIAAIGDRIEQFDDQTAFLAEAARRGLKVEMPDVATVMAVNSESVIAAWIAERNEDHHPPSAKAIGNKRSKLAAMFAFLRHDDMGKIGEADLKRYRLHLLPKGLAYDHLTDVIAMFGVAHRAGLITSNPAAEIKVPRKVRNSRDVFDPAEQAAILAAARQSDNPVIKWGTLLSAFSGAAGKELFEAETSDVYEVDGLPVFHVRAAKTDFRPRVVPVHSAIRDEFLAYVASLPAGPLFPATADNASHTLAKFIRGLGDKVAAGKTAYCWRHTVCTALERVPGVSADLARHIVGHAPRDVHARNYLHPSLADCVKAIEGLA